MPRTHILCFDGTRCEYDGDNTNVVKFLALLEKDEKQLCYYQPGIGTYTDPSIIAPIQKKCAEILDYAVAWYLGAHVMGGYKFLMQNYLPGDKICLFGFSRGAYTARALAGMLDRVGLLSKDNLEQVPFAFSMYSDKKKVALCEGFKHAFSRQVTVDFVGVWDTVASVGLCSATLPFTTSDNATTIKVFRHALSLDERRAKFRPTLFHKSAPTAADASKDLNAGSSPTSPFGTVKTASMSKSHGLTVMQPRLDYYFAKKGTLKSREGAPREGTSSNPDSENIEDDDAPPHPMMVPEPKTDVLEVWFCGNHSDIGGGNDTDNIVHSIANIPLNWMIRQVIAAQCGIRFNAAALARANISLASFMSTVPATLPERPPPIDEDVLNNNKSMDSLPAKSRRGTDLMLQEAAIDVTQKINDELKFPAFWWWLLELVPTCHRWQCDRGVWIKKWSLHFGRGRFVPMDHPKFHWTVKWRMENKNLKYKPRARYTPGSETYVW